MFFKLEEGERPCTILQLVKFLPIFNFFENSSFTTQAIDTFFVTHRGEPLGPAMKELTTNVRILIYTKERKINPTTCVKILVQFSKFVKFHFPFEHAIAGSAVLPAAEGSGDCRVLLIPMKTPLDNPSWGIFKKKTFFCLTG